ncbi:hypothetical protein [Nitrososphaera viennensis]|nr:hypothetical protein [Nitrososphaera viennensis]UVS69822.1 hypothetical protein NWT39_03310 [Nitrososphaera viennensis]
MTAWLDNSGNPDPGSIGLPYGEFTATTAAAGKSSFACPSCE